MPEGPLFSALSTTNLQRPRGRFGCDQTVVGVGAFDDPFVGILATRSNIIKPVGVGALDDPSIGTVRL